MNILIGKYYDFWFKVTKKNLSKFFLEEIIDKFKKNIFFFFILKINPFTKDLVNLIENKKKKKILFYHDVYDYVDPINFHLKFNTLRIGLRVSLFKDFEGIFLIPKFSYLKEVSKIKRINLKIKFEVDKLLKVKNEIQNELSNKSIEELIKYKKEGLDYGKFAFEKLLRSDDYRIHLLQKELREILIKEIINLFLLIEKISYSINLLNFNGVFFSKHYAYQMGLINEFLIKKNNHMISLNKLHYFCTTKIKKQIENKSDIKGSNLYNANIDYLHDIHTPNQKEIDHIKESLKNRLSSLNELQYMNVNETTAAKFVGLIKFLEKKSFNVEIDDIRNNKKFKWYIYLHAFSDIPLQFGYDTFYTKYNYFFEVLKFIKKQFPDDEIIFRLHPNNYKNYDFNNINFDKKDINISNLDIQLFIYLIRSLNIKKIFLSEPVLSSDKIIPNDNKCIITHSGNVLFECLYLNKPFICSQHNLIADIIEDNCKVELNNFRDKIIQIKSNIIKNNLGSNKNFELFLKYTAKTIFTKNGRKRFNFLTNDVNADYINNKTSKNVYKKLLRALIRVEDDNDKKIFNEIFKLKSLNDID